MANVADVCIEGRRETMLPTGDSSDLDARAELDDAVSRNVEEVGDVAGVARHRGEHAVAPERHARATRHRHHFLAREEERRFHEIDVEPCGVAELERARDIELVHEAVAYSHPPAAMPEALTHDAVLEGHPG